MYIKNSFKISNKEATKPKKIKDNTQNLHKKIQKANLKTCSFLSVMSKIQFKTTTIYHLTLIHRDKN